MIIFASYLSLTSNELLLSTHFTHSIPRTQVKFATEFGRKFVKIRITFKNGRLKRVRNMFQFFSKTNEKTYLNASWIRVKPQLSKCSKKTSTNEPSWQGDVGWMICERQRDSRDVCKDIWLIAEMVRWSKILEGLTCSSSIKSKASCTSGPFSELH